MKISMLALLLVLTAACSSYADEPVVDLPEGRGKYALHYHNSSIYPGARPGHVARIVVERMKEDGGTERVVICRSILVLSLDFRPDKFGDGRIDFIYLALVPEDALFVNAAQKSGVRVTLLPDEFDWRAPVEPLARPLNVSLLLDTVQKLLPAQE